MTNTMDSITACWKRFAEVLRGVVLVLGLFACGVVSAQVEVVSPQLQASEDGYVVSADFVLDLTPRLEEAVGKGVVLAFLVEFEMHRPRWYWFDEKVLARQKEFRLSYHALTRQYRVSSGGLHQAFPTLGEALRVIGRLRNWVVAERGNDKLRVGESYVGTLRMRLDTSQLPKPFQIAALGSKEWSLSSDWKSWPFALPAGEGK